MDEEKNNFCTSCGAPLRDSDTFCASCGSTREAARTYSSSQQYSQSQAKKNTLPFIGIACLLWAAVALFIGIFFIYCIDYLVDAIMADASWDVYSETLNEESLRSLFLTIGAILIASGAFSAISAILCFLKKMYIVALISCIIASVLGLIILAGIVGIFVAFFINKNKGEFIGGASLSRPKNI
ncbi:MAG: zinc ribbon domain-containing protein [Methanomassiliicoccaceae archaeon]|nr:zinc ribbon domain-containing protein [Methanomassiliicoccaceae archaeon]